MIQLVPMNEQEYQDYLSYAIANYGQEHVKSGQWNQEEALEEATKEYQHYLPDGLQTPNQYLYSIVDEQSRAKVGILWFALSERAGEKTAFVYDVMVYEQFRRHGYGEQAFRELETKARSLGVTKISLHVFGHNHGAIAMYEKLGYIATDINMSKSLNPQTP